MLLPIELLASHEYCCWSLARRLEMTSVPLVRTLKKEGGRGERERERERETGKEGEVERRRERERESIIIKEHSTTQLHVNNYMYVPQFVSQTVMSHQLTLH